MRSRLKTHQATRLLRLLRILSKISHCHWLLSKSTEISTSNCNRSRRRNWHLLVLCTGMFLTVKWRRDLSLPMSMLFVCRPLVRVQICGRLLPVVMKCCASWRHSNDESRSKTTAPSKDGKSVVPESTVCHAEDSAERASLSRSGGPGRVTREPMIFWDVTCLASLEACVAAFATVQSAGPSFQLPASGRQ